MSTSLLLKRICYQYFLVNRNWNTFNSVQKWTQQICPAVGSLIIAQRFKAFDLKRTYSGTDQINAEKADGLRRGRDGNDKEPSHHKDIKKFKHIDSLIKHGDLLKAESNIKQLLDKNEEIPTVIFAQLIGKFIEANAVEDALRVYQLASSKHKSFVIDLKKTLSLVATLVSKSRYDEAYDILQRDNYKNTQQEAVWITQCQHVIMQILRELQHQGQSAELERFFNAFVKKGVPLKSEIISPLVAVFLDQNQLDAAFESFCNVAQAYRLTPCKHNLLCKLIESQDVERLNRVVAVASDIHNENNSLYDLAVALIVCNRVAQANDVFKKLEINSGRLHKTIEHFSNELNAQKLESLLTATKDYISSEDRLRIYEQLLLVYCRLGENDNVTTLCASMQAENICPSEDVIKKLRHVRNLLPVAWSKATNENVHTKSAIEQAVDANQLNAAESLILNQIKENKPFDRRVLRFFLSKCSQNGNVDMLTSLSDHLDDETKLHVQFDAYLFKAYVNAKQPEKYLDYLSSVTDARKIPIESIQILEQYPHLLKQYEDLANKFAENNILKPMCILWIHHFCSDNVETCDTIWKNHLIHRQEVACKLATDILFMKRDLKRWVLFENMLDKTKIRKKSLGRFYSGLIDLFVFQNEYEGAVEALKRALTFVSHRELKESTLNRLKYAPNVATKVVQLLNRKTTTSK